MIFLVSLTGSALSLNFDYDERYVHDDSGAYVPDDSGRYINDNSGEYVHDNSGNYIHQPGPDGPNGPDYRGEATSIGVSILSPSILPADTRTYLPPLSASPPRVRPLPPLELPLFPSGTGAPPTVLIPAVTPIRPANPSVRPLLPANPSVGSSIPASPPVGLSIPANPSVRPFAPANPFVKPFAPANPPVGPFVPITPSVKPFAPTNPSVRPFAPDNLSVGPFTAVNPSVRPLVPANAPGNPSSRPFGVPPISREPPSRGTITIPGPPPAEISSSTKRPGIRGGGPYIWHYESTGRHTVDVIDPYHRYRVHFLPH